MDLKEEFNTRYAAALSEEGFVYGKRYDMHIRFVNGELFQYVRYVKLQRCRKGYREFNVEAGIVSVYAYSLLKKDLANCAVSVSEYAMHLFGVRDIPQCYSYNDENMKTLIDLSLKGTIKYVIPVLNQVTGLDSYIEYCRELRIDILGCADRCGDCKNDALVLIQAKNHDDFEDFFQKRLDCTMTERRKMTGTVEEGFYESQYELLHHGIVELIAGARDREFKDIKKKRYQGLYNFAIGYYVSARYNIAALIESI